MKNYFGFAISDSMFSGDVTVTRKCLSEAETRELLRCWKNDGTLVPCLNPSHKATIDAMRERFNIEVAIPETAPRCELVNGDSLLLLQVKGLPRLDATRHEYTKEEIASAIFTFSVWKVL